MADKALYDTYDWLIRYEESIEQRIKSHKVKVDFQESIPMVLLSFVLWGLAMKLIDQKEGDRWVSTVHSLYVVIVSSMNLYFGVDAQHFEEHLFVVMAGYFMADYVVYVLPGNEKIVYFFHHFITAYAVYRIINLPNWSMEMYASKCILLEGSTPFLNWWKKSRSPFSGMLFATSFFLLRVVWLGRLSYFGWDLAHNNLEKLVIITFTALNFFWFYQIVQRALLQKRKPKTIEQENKSD